MPQQGYFGRMRRPKTPGFALAKMRAAPMRMIRSAEPAWIRRLHRRRGTARAGLTPAPKNVIKKITSPMVTPKIRNASRPVRNPPIPMA